MIGCASHRAGIDVRGGATLQQCVNERRDRPSRLSEQTSRITGSVCLEFSDCSGAGELERLELEGARTTRQFGLRGRFGWLLYLRMLTLK